MHRHDESGAERRRRRSSAANTLDRHEDRIGRGNRQRRTSAASTAARLAAPTTTERHGRYAHRDRLRGLALHRLVGRGLLRDRHVHRDDEPGAKRQLPNFVAVHTLTRQRRAVPAAGRQLATSARSTAARPAAATTTTAPSVTLSCDRLGRLPLHRLVGRGCTGTGTCTVTMSQARSVTASFVAVYTLTRHEEWLRCGHRQLGRRRRSTAARPAAATTTTAPSVVLDCDRLRWLALHRLVGRGLLGHGHLHRDDEPGPQRHRRASSRSTR